MLPGSPTCLNDWTTNIQEPEPFHTFKEQPSDYFRRQCWISSSPEEELIPNIINKVGADKFFWASDFPHHDGFPGVVGAIRDLLGPLPAET